MSDKIDMAAYEAEAAEARRRITETIGDIRHRLNPKTIANEAVDAALERGAAAARSAKQTISENTVGLSVAGAALGVILGARGLAKGRKNGKMTQYDDEFEMNEAKSRLAGVKETASQVRGNVVEKAGAAREYTAGKLAAARDYTAETWQTTRERAGEYAGQAKESAQRARERAGEYAEYAKERAERARERTAEGVNDNPMTAVLIGAAAGAIIGALLPRTTRENRALGRTRDKLAETAKSAASAARVAGIAKFEEMGIKEQAKSTVRELKESATEIARTAKEAVAEKTKKREGAAEVATPAAAMSPAPVQASKSVGSTPNGEARRADDTPLGTA